MEKSTLISVVVPAFNEEKEIGRCLKALKNQSFPQGQYEIIVVNNNSTDKTAQIAQKMGARVVLEKKKGYVFALRKGCSQTKGEIIAITDADTVVPRNWLKKIYQSYQKSSQIVCVGGRAVFRPKNFLSRLNEPIWNIGGQLFKKTPGFNLSIRKETYQKIGGFRKEVNFDTDFDLCLRVKKEGELVFLWDNPVVSSSRHFQGIEGGFYCLKGAVNTTSLALFKKPLVFEFKDVRE